MRGVKDARARDPEQSVLVRHNGDTPKTGQRGTSRDGNTPKGAAANTRMGASNPRSEYIAPSYGQGNAAPLRYGWATRTLQPRKLRISPIGPIGPIRATRSDVWPPKTAPTPCRALLGGYERSR
jgi:hypothetical protein